ncbi:MAG TPA: CheR family methyltransferase [Schlesneria sp.]|jgi:chemotaxis methyl-accepting protein methylase
MIRGGYAQRFEHINFPREEMRRVAINLAPTGPRQSFSSAQLPSWSPEEMEFVIWLLAQSGLDARCYRPETLQRRLPACLRRLRAQSIQHAREVLAQDPNAVAAATSAMLVGVTSFFRDPSVFEQLGQELRRTVEERGQGAYAWSIGCSEGAELYSLSMQLADCGHLAGSYLLGTDCRVDAIEQARAANYDAALTRQVPATFLSRYFERNGTCFRICQHLRQSVRWRVSSILSEFESGLWDVIFFRNTALYLSPESVMALWPKLETALRPGGLLVLGRAERPYGAQRLRAIGPCLYRRQAR